MDDRISVLSDLRWGIERETHRVKRDGSLSQALHPAALVAPTFTRDFAESQLELVTRPRQSIREVVAELESLTAEAWRAIGDETLWPFSIPPLLPPDEEIVTARLGSGGKDRLAQIYRAGLSARYGKARQMICGVHVNVSLGESLLDYLASAAPLTAEEAKDRSISDGYYLRLARNILEGLPIFVMAFGASPVAADGPALGDERTIGAAQGTPSAAQGTRLGVTHGAAISAMAYSTRNSPLGYARSEYRPFFELGSLDAHIAGIRRGLNTESAEFRKLALVRDGRIVQLNDRVFQRDKEFYAPFRFRRVIRSGENALSALERRGVEYLELRFFDVDPSSAAGVSRSALQLLHLFLLDALTTASVPRSNGELRAILARADRAALADPRFVAYADVEPIALALANRLDPFARALGSDYARALQSFRRAALTPGESTAARVAADFAASGLAWTEYGAGLAARNKREVCHESA